MSREVSCRKMDRLANQGGHVKVRYCHKEVSHSKSQRPVPVSLTTGYMAAIFMLNLLILEHPGSRRVGGNQAGKGRRGGERGSSQSNEKQPQQKLTKTDRGGVETQSQSNLPADNGGCPMSGPQIGLVAASFTSTCPPRFHH